MDNKKYMGILRLFKKKSVKLSLVCLSLIGMLLSSGASFAKYRDENYGGGNAGAAKFGSWSVQSNMAPINVPENAPTGWYAFKADFSVLFTSGEVSRQYTLKIKDVAIGADANNYNSLVDNSNSSFFLSESSTIRTITRTTNTDGTVTSKVEASGVENLLMSRNDLPFTTNNVYMMYEETHAGSAKGSPWRAYSINDTIYDSTTSSILLSSDHVLAPNEEDMHVFYLIYFIKIEQVSNLQDIKFIYSLDVRQVM